MFETSSYAEMLALLRAVIDAKFHPNPEDVDVPGSSILARAAVRLRECIIEEDARQHGPSARAYWAEWMRLGPDRPEWATALQYAVKSWAELWSTWSAEEKWRAARDLLSPFEPTQEQMNRFLDEVGDLLR